MNEELPTSLPPSGPPLAKPPRPPGAVDLPEEREGPLPAWQVCLLVSLVACIFLHFGISGMQHYGYGVFTIIPLALGFVTTRLYARERDTTWYGTLGVVVATTLSTGVFLMFPPLEGVICMAMAAGVASPFILIGMLIAYLMRDKPGTVATRGTKLQSFILVAVPFSMALETHVAPPPPILEQTTSIEINAPPEQVWRYIPSFPKIEVPPTGLLKLGLAYPLASEMTGEGIGAGRRCVLSTGTMPEVITAWEPGKRLEFDVLATPKAMEETNPFGEVKAAHVEGYFLCKHGRFVLTALPGGRTRVEGTSWFQHDLWPQFYWAPLTKEVVHEVHDRVLLHIKRLAEENSGAVTK